MCMQECGHFQPMNEPNLSLEAEASCCQKATAWETLLETLLVVRRFFSRREKGPVTDSTPSAREARIQNPMQGMTFALVFPFFNDFNG